MAVTDKLTIAVTYDPAKDYIGTSPDLRQPVIALSLSGLRRKVKIAMLPDEVVVELQLDEAARLERDRRLSGPHAGFAGTSA
jgi:hypothetical protein